MYNAQLYDSLSLNKPAQEKSKVFNLYSRYLSLVDGHIQHTVINDIAMYDVGFRRNIAAKDQLLPRGVGWFHALRVPHSRQHGCGGEAGWRWSGWQHRRHSCQHSRYIYNEH